MLVHTSVVLAQIAVSANDNKLMLVNGAATVVQNPAPDTVAIIDLKQFPPKILAEIEVPASVVGPPLSVEQKKLTRLAEAPIGHWSQGVAFTPDNQYVLVQNMVEKDIMIFKLDGGKLEDTGQRLKMKGGPAAMRTAEKPL